MKDKKSNYISLGIVLVLVMFVVGVTYAMFSFRVMLLLILKMLKRLH